MKARHHKSVPPSDLNQMIIAGVEPVNLVERLAWAAQKPLQPKRAQCPLDIGFWDPMRDQLEIF